MPALRRARDALPNNHPAMVALRTYTLALTLSLGPTLVSTLLRPAPFAARLPALRNILARELRPTGFAFAITLAVTGGLVAERAVTRLRRDDDDDAAHPTPPLAPLLARLRPHLSRLSDEQVACLSNALFSAAAILLLHARRPSSPIPAPPLPLTVPVSSPGVSPTLDLTLLLVVRALDVLVHATIFKRVHGSGDARKTAVADAVAKVDALTFWAASARIMWCFFYMPDSLPRSYLKWITTLADMDMRLITALQALRTGDWKYTTGYARDPSLLTSLATDLGHPASWGDPYALPSHGGRFANNAWAVLGVQGRTGVGGIPCDLVHGTSGSGSSCVGNAGIRWMRGFANALAIYLPVHILPTLLTQPTALLRPTRLVTILMGTLRSSSFLATFISSIWLAVCLTRTLLLARLLPNVSHDFWDGPHGCILAGCLVCGGSITLEKGKRRGEMALYVLPRAVRTCLPEKWIRRGSRAVWLERLVFAVALSNLLTSASYRPEALRGLSRWTLQFVMNGPDASLWMRRRKDTMSGENTPSDPLSGYTTPKEPSR